MAFVLLDCPFQKHRRTTFSVPTAIGTNFHQPRPYTSASVPIPHDAIHVIFVRTIIEGGLNDPDEVAACIVVYFKRL